MVTKSPYGTWKSPLSPDSLIQDSFRFSFMHVANERILFGEGRPKEKGRTALVEVGFNKKQKDLLPKEYNMRTQVHEYGGKSFTMHENAVYFVNLKDQDIYKIETDSTIHRITKQEHFRFADLCVSPDGRFLFCVAESHESKKVENMLVRVCLSSNEIEIIATGYDFYSSVVVSPDAKRIAWFSWNQPNMPWDETELFIADISDKKGLTNVTLVATEASCIHPQFSKDNTLYFISDSSGYWNLYTYKEETIHPVYPIDVEFGAPCWVFGMMRYVFLETGHIACIGTKKAVDSLYIIDPHSKKIVRIDTPFTQFSDLYVSNDLLVFHAASPTQPSCIATYNLKNKEIHVLKEFSSCPLDIEDISIPVAISFPTEGGKTAYGFYYPPTNKNYLGLDDEKPPVIVNCHGGPSSHVSPVLQMKHLFYTTRGFGVFELNYSGSTGYGSEYRNRLKRNWGVVDLHDCENLARYLKKKGLVDPEKLIIKGGSAGGYSVLCALTYLDSYKAGACYYGVADMEALAKDTHKFEAKYLDLIVGSYPKDKKTYIERSPIHHCEKLSCPIIFFQGTEDKCVPPEQSDMMVQALRDKKIPVSYLLFKGEGHGFRMAESIKASIEAELYFFSKIFNFTPADKLKKIKIDNLP
ncbi:peptidase [Candidatus Aerophobetes bacterium]|uniref:Peptidase n=1 Tax=Aerophobetes bacterium TaxID=2030807 RepID=A0A2A4YMS5_UNCAE|nr:MAG: peptidase [Candidatus Aerophobetes bacterium]